MAERVDVFGITDVGKVRKQNEDQFLIAALAKSMKLVQTSLEDVTVLRRLEDSEADLFVVADGVGGSVGGKWASNMAVEALVEHVTQTLGCYYSNSVDVEHEFLDQLEQAVRRAHANVKVNPNSGAPGPASTLTMVTLIGPRAYYVHVGDSRAYCLRSGEFQQITKDQTLAERLVDGGVMTAEDASGAGLDNVLTSVVGGEISPTVGLIDLNEGDWLVLCTDGLTKHVTDVEIADVLARSEGAESACRHLLALALADGGTDNVTVVAARVEQL